MIGYKLTAKGRTIRKVKGGVGYFFMFAYFFQVVNRVCNFLMDMLHCMHNFIQLHVIKLAVLRCIFQCTP